MCGPAKRRPIRPWGARGNGNSKSAGEPVVDTEKAQIGVLISLQEPTQPMRTTAAGAGFYESPWGTHPRLQVLTIGEILAGKKIDMPPLGQVNRTFRRAPTAKQRPDAVQGALLLDD
jgi:hypothetical protein